MARRKTAAASSIAVVLLACSSTSAPGGGSSVLTPAADPSVVAVQRYLAAVNALCDALLPKVVAVTGGGSLDIPRRAFFEQLPEHQRLRDRFDRDLARIPVPPEAQDAAQALEAYLRFADDLDAKRLKAARQGRAAYRREITAELKYAANDPSVAARNAAGFHDSCSAR